MRPRHLHTPRVRFRFPEHRAHRSSIAEKKVRSFNVINQKQPTPNNGEREREPTDCLTEKLLEIVLVFIRWQIIN